MRAKSGVWTAPGAKLTKKNKKKRKKKGRRRELNCLSGPESKLLVRESEDKKKKRCREEFCRGDKKDVPADNIGGQYGESGARREEGAKIKDHK